ncbi:MAG: hypothetical protein NVV73_19565 [Cellvibrionaceae bacterium]|nr:hypothetical protein [Cellvibrionaceae bacterium]
MSSRQLEGMQAVDANQRLAAKPVVSYEDLPQVDREVDAGASDAGLNMNTLLIFLEESPDEILEKIPDLQAYTFSLHASFLATVGRV